MPEEGGRPSLVVTEVYRAPDVAGRRRWRFVIGHVDRVRDQTVQGAREATTSLIRRVEDENPCVFVDIGTPQGLALRRSFRTDWPEKNVHLPHAYPRLPRETMLFAAFLEAYADRRVSFLTDVGYRKDLDKALVLYRGGKISTAAAEIPSEDESLVVATCLSLMWPSHGPDPRTADLATNDDGNVQ